MKTTVVGVREFRLRMARYFSSSTTIAVTRHGLTIGYFIPTKGLADADDVSLKIASKPLSSLLEAKSVDALALAPECKAARKRPSRTK